MGKPQGDNLPEAIMYERVDDNGEVQQRPAFVPADHINLQARGWTRQDQAAEQERPAAAEKPAGSQRREAARVVPAQSAAAPADGGSSA